MKCPKCGYHRQTRDNAFVPATECPSCGVVYSKHETKKPGGPARGATHAPPSLKPSPVDAESLKKARDRVEQRLRKRLGTHEEDDRHARTLELARRFTEEEMRKRQEKLEQEQSSEDEHAASMIPEAQGPETVAEEKALEADGEDRTAQMEAQHPADEETTDQADVETQPHETMERPDNMDATESVETPEPMTTEAATDADPSYPVPPMPDEAPDSDVSVETVILTSAASVTNAQASAQEFDATPLAVDDASSDEETTPLESEPMEEDQSPDVPAAVVASQAPAFRRMHHGGGHLRMLSAVAWLILGAGVIGAILSWTTISDVEAGMRIPVPDSVNTLSLGLLLGFAYLATGVLGFAFFWVSSTISRQLKDIRRLLMLHPGAPTYPGQSDEMEEDNDSQVPAQV